MEMISIKVLNLVGSSFCVEAEDGNKLFDYIQQAFKENKGIKLDFLNVEMLTSAFLNSAIGQLYRDFKEEEIRRLLVVENLASEDVALLKRVITTAKLFFKYPERMQNSINEILGDDNEKTL